MPWIFAPIVRSLTRYFAERKEAEVGWNTWLSGDMLTHAYLPHGLAVRLAFTHAGGGSVLTDLGEEATVRCRLNLAGTQHPNAHVRVYFGRRRCPDCIATIRTHAALFQMQSPHP